MAGKGRRTLAKDRQPAASFGMIAGRALGSRRWALVIATVASLGLSAGCGYREVERTTQPATFTVAHCPQSGAQLPRYDGWGEQLGAGAVPQGFAPVRAASCTWSEQFVDDSLTRQRYVVTEGRAAAVTPDFLASLDLPDQAFRRFSHDACPAVANAPFYLLLIDARDRAVVPRLPQNPCGGPRTEVENAISGLGLTDATTYEFEADR